jgi:hypothetical protein
MNTHLVMFCCNDERGHFAGRVEQVSIGGEIELVCVADRSPVMKWTERDRYTHAQIGRRAYRCVGKRQTCVGNVFWDAIEMPETEALKLVAGLLNNGWSVEQYAEDGPFASLARSAS